MSQPLFWWIATAVTLAVEMATGTIYLLMVSIGLVGAAVAAHVGAGPVTQMLTAACLGGFAVVVWHLRRLREPAPLPAGRNPDMNLDIGQRVHVAHWHSDGTARAEYRGASWAVRYQGGGTPAPGEYLIHAIDGSELLLGR